MMSMQLERMMPQARARVEQQLVVVVCACIWLAAACLAAPLNDTVLPMEHALPSSTAAVQETLQPAPCDVDARTKAGAVIADCRHRQLTAFPSAALLPVGVTELLLTGNRLTTLYRADLAGLGQLRNLFIGENQVNEPAASVGKKKPRSFSWSGHGGLC
jgi:hypothetical protein